MTRVAEQLGILLSEKTADFKVISQRYDADGPMQDRALEIVRKFIADKKLIIYGGLSIDYALRLRGRSIYPDAQRPDFDFYSPRNVEDAYELANILQRAGFKDVGAIRAIHVQTIRVRVDFIFVADISYAPPDVFARFPTVNYEGLRVLHPDYQRLDMHLAFCFPFNGAPREDVFHRWSKDVKRFALLQETYPIRPGALEHSAAVAGGASSTAVLETDLAVDVASDFLALHGIAAFGILLSSLRELEKIAAVAPSPEAFPSVDVSVEDTKVAVKIPAEHAAIYNFVTIATPQPEKICEAKAGCRIQWFEPYMDAKPETAVIQPPGDKGAPLHVFSVKGRQLAVIATRIGKTKVLSVTPQYLLLHFLHEAHQASNEAQRTLMTQYYLWTLAILHIGASIISDNLESIPPSDKEFDRDKFINSSPFGLTTRVMGDVNHDAAYIIKIADAAQAVGDTPPATLHLGIDVKKILDGLPQRGYYPATSKKPPPPFDYSRNILFRRSGRPKTI